MPKTANNRKARFRAALALAGMTAEEWAEQQDVTPGHLSQVLAGKRESQTLIEKIEAFTKKHVAAVAA
jgi:hypothetical protein